MKRLFQLSVIICMMFAFGITSYAHPGKLDGQGGHKDPNNVSGLGPYHYHCGSYPAHLHINGVCPYQTLDAQNEANKQALGQWKNDSKGWWYELSDGTIVKGQWLELDGKWYCFHSSGYMAIGWQRIDGNWYYFRSSGEMATGWIKHDELWYYLDENGVQVEDGRMTIDGKIYYFDEDGVCMNP